MRNDDARPDLPCAGFPAWVTLAAISLLSLPFAGCAPRAAQKRPNILFIMSDDHSASAIASYGSHLSGVVRTPSLDRIAAEGARLTRVFCTNSICAPSRATILTGQYSHRNGIYTLHETLRPEQPNVAKEMQRLGYQTAIVGKWHLKADPSGFDHWSVMEGQGRYRDPSLRSEDGTEREYPGYSTDVVTDLCIRRLEERDPARPLFLMCQYKAPHDRWTSAERFDDWYRDEPVPEPPNLRDDYSNRFSRAGQVWSTLERMVPDGYFREIEPSELEGMTRDERRARVYQSFVRQYLRTAQAVDENVGRLLDALDRHGLADDTVVIYTSDQGVFVGEHGYFDKRFMYEESLRMPFLVRYPREIRPGSVVDELVENTDFAPLFVDYAGGELPAFMQGRSFRAALRGEALPDWRQATYYRYWMHMSHFAIPAHYGIRTERFKLIYYYGEPLGMEDTEFVRRWVEGSPRIEPTEPEWELFDLERDPHEMRDVHAEPEYAEDFARLKLLLLEKKRAVGDEDERYPVLMAQRERYW